MDIAQIGRRKMVILQLALRIACERRMRLIVHAGLDMNLIHAEGDLFRGRIVRQRAAMFVQISYLRHRICRQRHQLIGALQVMILQRWRINLREEIILVFAVCLRGIEMLGAFGERGIKNRLALVRRRIRIVPKPAVTGGKRYSQQAYNDDSHGAKFSRIARSRLGQG